MGSDTFFESHQLLMLACILTPLLAIMAKNGWELWKNHQREKARALSANLSSDTNSAEQE
jgi:hypothetical protein